MTKRSIALIISAHNEELVLADTVNSALAEGQKPDDIYVIADACSDATARIAIDILGIRNVISTTKRSKAKAIMFGVQEFGLVARYKWIHIADADSTFGEKYFTVLRKKLNPAFAAATGYIKSREGSYVSAFRVLEYTWGMEVIRRTQSWLHTIPVIPGPSSIFRSDVFAQLDWEAPTVAEDFDVTLQIHRKKLGNIQYIPEIKANTQDPYTFKDYVKQISRWNKGTFQSMHRHKIGARMQMIDAYLGFQVLQSLYFIGVFLVVMPLIAYYTNNPALVAAMFLYDVMFTLLLCIFSALKTKRSDVLANFPLVYGMKWVQAAVFLRFFFAVYVLRKYRGDTAWAHKVTRYAA